LLLAHLSLGCPIAAADTVASPREAAVAQARAGHVDVAIRMLRDLLAQGSTDPLVSYDLVDLLQQSGDSKSAIAVFEAAGAASAPEYALLAATRAYRDQRQYDAAEKLAQSGAARFPGNPSWPILLSLILSDAGRADQALETLASPAAARAPDVERKRAEAYALRKAGRPLDALRVYMDALRLDPADRGLRAEAASLMREIGAPNGAAALVDLSPPAETGAARLALSADQAGSQVRWGGDIRPRDPARRFDDTNAALARIDQLIAEAKATQDVSPDVLSHLRFDRLVALRDRVRMTEVISDSDVLINEGIMLPPYAARARADAFLYLQRPEEAAAAYQHVIAGNPDDRDARYGLFYAQVESEDFNAAYKTIDDLVTRQPANDVYVDDPSPKPNSDYWDAVIGAALARFYGDQLSDAEDRIAPIAAAAPANPSVRIANAEVMNARGHPRAAEEEAMIAASLDPLDLGTQKFLVSLDIQKFRFAAARDRLRKLQALYPEDIGVQHLARELAAETGWLFELEGSPSWSNGGGSNASGQELTINGRLWSPPIDDRWRLFLLDDYAYGHPEEGFVERNRTGAGVEFRTEDLRLTAYGTYSTGELDDPGGGVSLDWSIDDYFSIGLAGEIYTIDTPLRALIADTKADQVSATATYRWHESREITLSGAYLDFDDGNEQAQAGLDFQQRLVDIPHFDLTGRIDVFASSNSRQDVNYYAPERDLTATAGLLAEHVLWRDYDNSLVQAFTLDAGAYAEEGFGTDWVGSIGYEHRWAFQPRTEFRYGVTLARNVFDGDDENSVALTFGLQQKF
jgi:biofilm PGA synthesis protein PgaA